LCEEIDDRVKTFLERPIEGDWPYLWIDATNPEGPPRRAHCLGRGHQRSSSFAIWRRWLVQGTPGSVAAVPRESQIVLSLRAAGGILLCINARSMLQLHKHNVGKGRVCMQQIPFQPLPSHEAQPDDIILVKRHPSAPELRCEGMLLTVVSIHAWGVTAYARLPTETTNHAVQRLIGRQERFSLGWMDFVLTGGKNPSYGSPFDINST